MLRPFSDFRFKILLSSFTGMVKSGVRQVTNRVGALIDSSSQAQIPFQERAIAYLIIISPLISPFIVSLHIVRLTSLSNYYWIRGTHLACDSIYLSLKSILT